MGGAFDNLNKNKVKKKTTGVGNEIEINIEKIYRNPEQPRKSFKSEHIEGLQLSIKENGLLNAINVVVKDDGYMIVAGECRWLACVANEDKTIRCNIINADDYKILELSFIENIQREDLTPYEIASHIIKLWQTGKYALRGDLAKIIGKSPSFISKCLSALKVDESIIEDILEKKADVSIEIINALSSIKDSALQCELYEQEATREAIREAKEAYKTPVKYIPLSFHFNESVDWKDIEDAIKKCGHKCEIIIKEIECSK